MEETEKITKLSTKGFRIICKNKQCIGGKIDVLLGFDEGYSNWTVMEKGFFSLKCHGCGKFGTTDKSAQPNELANFDVECLECGRKNNFLFLSGKIDKDIKPFLMCEKCGQIVVNIIKKYE